MRFYEADLNNDISEIVEEYINYSFPKDLENVKKTYWKQIYIYLTGKLFNSESFLNLYKDIYFNRLKKKYVFEENYIYEISKILINKKNYKDLDISYKKKIIDFFKENLLFIFIKLAISILQFTSIKNNKISYLCFAIDPYQRNIFSSFLNGLDFKIYDIKSMLFSFNFSLKKKYSFDLSNLNKNYKFINIIQLKYAFFYSALLNLDIKKILFIEGDNYESSLISLICNKKKIKTECFQWGVLVSDVLKSGFRFMNFDRYYTYGKYYSEYFSRYNKETQFIETGFSLIEYKFKNQRNNSIAIVLSQKNIFINDTVKIELNKLIKLLIKNNFNIIIRTHPLGETKNDIINEFGIKDFRNIKFHDSRKMIINETLKSVDMIVCTRSSTIAESASVGVIPIVLNNDEIVWEKNIERLKNIFDQKLILGTSEHAFSLINLLNDNIELRENISKEMIKIFYENIILNGNKSLEILKEKIVN